LDPDVEIISSLAGRVPDPALPVGRVRVGGFGGVDGMCTWLHDNTIDAVVDATHPFAATITANAAAACKRLDIPHLILARPAWDSGKARRVGSNLEAAKVVADSGFARVFLTSGRSSVVAFSASDAWFLIRVVTAPDPSILPRNHRVVLSRGPYCYDDDRELMHRNRIDALVTKNSGGALTESKLAAASDLGIEVIMIDRPVLPSGVTDVTTVDEAVVWVSTVRSDSAAG
jgi:precorrin-6A/cobalt-precorrin-6A reductase